MPTARQPRAGSLQFWPRKRSKRISTRTRNAPEIKEPGLVGFAGYKAGMTHAMAIETRKTSHYKGEEIAVPVTIIECPPVKIAAIRLYKKTAQGFRVVNEIFFQKKDKELSRKLRIPKKNSELDKIGHEYDDVRVLVFTQPKLTGIGKKKPDLFEMRLGGSVEEKINYVKENKDKEITFESVFKEGDMVDIKAVTKGKGFQGPVKRFGISLRQSKSEKSIRNPGSLGPWNAQGHIMWRVAHAGKMGYHQRTEYNKQILKICEPKEVNQKGGINRFGSVKNLSILVKGSVAGSKKRIIYMQKPIRKKKTPELPTIQGINLAEN
jgi:large subunit ribosomal protein L3